MNIELKDDNWGWKKGSMPLILLTTSVEIYDTSVCDVEKNAVLNVDGKGTTPLMLLTCKSEIFAIILLNVDANNSAYDDTNGSRPLILLTCKSVVIW